MAELIPIEYRLRVATRKRLTTWILCGFIATLASGVALAYAFAWERQRTFSYESLREEHKAKSILIAQSQELRGKRQNLASRMQKIQQLMDDRILLALLSNISSGFSASDCLEYVHVDARGAAKSAAGDTSDPYVVHISGITSNSTTLAELMTRLTKQSNPPMNVVLESSRRDTLMDGQVMRFQIVCEKPDNKGT